MKSEESDSERLHKKRCKFLERKTTIQKMINRMNKLAERLKEMRRAKGLTQREMARQFRLSDVGYGAWERGDTEPSIDNLMRLCAFFGCTSDSLIGLEPPKVTVDASEVKAKSKEAKGALDALFASIDRLE